MSITLEAFKKFAKIYVPPTPAKGANGIVVFTKNPPGVNIINVPQDTLVHTASGITFKTVEALELNESENFQPIAVTATGTGSATNVEANQTWSTSISGVDVTNPAPFSGGSDANPGVPTSEHLTDWIPPSDDVLQANLDLAQKNVLTKLGDPAELPDEPAVDRSVYLFAQFYTQNTTTQEQVTSFKGGDIEKQKTEYYRSGVFKAVNFEIDNLLRPFVDVSKFMSGVSV